MRMTKEKNRIILHDFGDTYDEQSGIFEGNWLPLAVCRDYLLNVLEILFFWLGTLYCMVRTGYAISKKRAAGLSYTRVLLPSFLFIPIADFFFLITSLCKGGLFRGWLRSK